MSGNLPGAFLNQTSAWAPAQAWSPRAVYAVETLYFYPEFLEQRVLRAVVRTSQQTFHMRYKSRDSIVKLP